VGKVEEEGPDVGGFKTVSDKEEWTFDGEVAQVTE